MSNLFLIWWGGGGCVTTLAGNLKKIQGNWRFKEFTRIFFWPWFKENNEMGQMNEKRVCYFVT
jgi:hypothetical protein